MRPRQRNLRRCESFSGGRGDFRFNRVKHGGGAYRSRRPEARRENRHGLHGFSLIKLVGRCCCTADEGCAAAQPHRQLRQREPVGGEAGFNQFLNELLVVHLPNGTIGNPRSSRICDARVVQEIGSVRRKFQQTGFYGNAAEGKVVVAGDKGLRERFISQRPGR